jgi:hypothetical protein
MELRTARGLPLAIDSNLRRPPLAAFRIFVAERIEFLFDRL